MKEKNRKEAPKPSHMTHRIVEPKQKIEVKLTNYQIPMQSSRESNKTFLNQLSGDPKLELETVDKNEVPSMIYYFFKEVYQSQSIFGTSQEIDELLKLDLKTTKDFQKYIDNYNKTQ